MTSTSTIGKEYVESVGRTASNLASTAPIVPIAGGQSVSSLKRGVSKRTQELKYNI